MSLAKRLLSVQPSGGGLVITESWNAADSSSMDADLTWTITENGFDIVSNRAKSEANGRCNAVADPAIGSNNVYVEAVVDTNSGTSGVGPTLCNVNTTTRSGYYFSLVRSNEIKIIRQPTGSQVDIATKSYTISASTIYTVRGEVSGGTVKMFVNGVEELSVVDGVPLTGAYAGIGAFLESGQSVFFDNFEAGTL